jgi:hypothetical protein
MMSETFRLEMFAPQVGEVFRIQADAAGAGCDLDRGDAVRWCCG